jgi:hypothetical protein
MTTPAEPMNAPSNKKSKPQEPLSPPADGPRDQSIDRPADPSDPKEVTDTKPEL